MRKTLGVVLILVILLAGTAGCASVSDGSTSSPAGSAVGEAEDVTRATREAMADVATSVATENLADGAVTGETTNAGQATVDLADYADATTIALGEAIMIDGPGASVSGATVTITAGGAYHLSGTLDDGQIVVDTQDKETVTLILGGVDITCSTSAPIYVMNAENAAIVLADGTENRVADGDSYIIDDAENDEPNATIFSKDDLTIGGGGTLTIDAHYDDALTSKDDLDIAGGIITVDFVGDGIRGRDSLVITGGTITVNAAGDGLESNNDEDPERGLISIEGGTLDITAGQDGIEAETRVIIRGGSITVSSGGGSANASSNIGSSGNTWGRWPGRSSSASDDSSVSAKGIKAGMDVTIDDGTIRVDSSDDAIHSNGSITINGGDIHLASGDDGIHADSDVTINGGDLIVSTSFEALESAVITINGGNMRLVASDDGINVAGGVDGSALGGRPGQNVFSLTGGRYFNIGGGYIVVDAMGDGLDINGTIEMTGGVVIIVGPTSNMNGALDYDRGFTISDGLLVAAGSAGMAQAPDTSSTQYSVMVGFPSPQPAGTMVHIEAEDGQDVLTFVPTRAYQSLVLSSPDLEKGKAYTVYVGGSSTGSATDGLYSGGTYSGGTEFAGFTVSGIVTTAGTAVGGRGGFRGAPGRR